MLLKVQYTLYLSNSAIKFLLTKVWSRKEEVNGPGRLNLAQHNITLEVIIIKVWREINEPNQLNWQACNIVYAILGKLIILVQIQLNWIYSIWEW